MSRGKTGLIVLTVFAAVFFLFLAFLFNSSIKRNAALERKAELDAKLDIISEADITIYWIGEPPKELEHLLPVISVVAPGTASSDNLPVKGPAFHFIEYNAAGDIIEEDTPVEYSDYMVIVMNGSPVLTDDGQEALLNAISQNGVPVIAIGNDAAETLGQTLSYRRVHKGPYSSLYYCLGSGYKENPIPEDCIKAGGMDLADTIPELIARAVSDYIPQE